jgi:hypothetical protein
MNGIYKDMTFCRFYTDCKEETKCHRALTDEVIQNALDRKMYISQFMDKPDCFMAKSAKFKKTLTNKT